MDEDNKKPADTGGSSEARVKFICPNCGEVAQEDVVFLCNTCDAKEVEKVDGVYLCSSCKSSANPIMCRICDSKEVHMHGEGLDLPGREHPHKGN